MRDQKIYALLALSMMTFAETKEPIGGYVGRLEALWQFPSDHLPIGISLDDLHIASWNVLDSKYMWWVTKKDSQGLQKSMLVDEHVYVGKTKLTIRDQHIVRLILEMIHHETHPRSLIALQECGEPFLDELAAHIPSTFSIIAKNGNAVLVDTSRFAIELEEALPIFADEKKRTVQNLLLKDRDTHLLLRLVNVHIPGDPARPGKEEFTNYLANSFDPTMTTIALGDMNFNEIEMQDALIQSFNGINSFTLYTPYCTNIAPETYYSKAIDHFIVHTASNELETTLNTPDQVLQTLETTADLLNIPHLVH